jgi:hypothetical protein
MIVSTISRDLQSHVWFSAYFLMVDGVGYDSLAQSALDVFGDSAYYRSIQRVYIYLRHLYPISYLVGSKARGYVHDPTVLPEAVCTQRHYTYIIIATNTLIIISECVGLGAGYDQGGIGIRAVFWSVRRRATSRICV